MTPPPPLRTNDVSQPFDDDRRCPVIQNTEHAWRLITQLHIRASDAALAHRMVQSGLQAQAERLDVLSDHLRSLNRDHRESLARCCQALEALAKRLDALELGNHQGDAPTSTGEQPGRSQP